MAQEWPRLERNRSEGVQIIEACQRHQVLLAFVKGNDIDTTMAAGRLVADVMSYPARQEIEVKGERQSCAQRQRAEQGRGPKEVRPLGYAINGDCIPEEAAAIKAIYEAFFGGSPVRAIAAALSGLTGDRAAAVPALPRHTRTLTLERNEKRAKDNTALPKEQQLAMRPVPDDDLCPPSTVLGILRNPRYIGYSTYTPKATHADGDRRHSWHASTLRDELHEPVRGQWEPIVDELIWWTVQEKLDDPGRVTNRVGTTRRHLGSGLFLCVVCNAPVKALSDRYRCAGHVMRSPEQIELFVLTTVRARLGRDDILDLIPGKDEPRLRTLKSEVDQHRTKIFRAQRDYDDAVLEGHDLKRILDRAGSAITVLEAERILLSADSSAGMVFGAENPVCGFDGADLGTQRNSIDALCKVLLFPHPRGVKMFNPDTIQIIWH